MPTWRLPKDSIARDGLPRATDQGTSSWFVLFRWVPESFLGLFHVIQGEFPGFDEVRHHELGPAAEYRQQLVNEPALRIITGSSGNRALSAISRRWSAIASGERATAMILSAA